MLCTCCSNPEPNDRGKPKKAGKGLRMHLDQVLSVLSARGVSVVFQSSKLSFACACAGEEDELLSATAQRARQQQRAETVR